MTAPSARYPTILIVILVSFAFILSACGGSIETDLTLLTDDRFDATSRIVVPAVDLMLVGGVEAIEAQFRELEQQATAEGVKFSWRKESSRNPNEIVYRISVSSTGYEKLADSYGINIQKTQYQDRDALLVSADPNYDLSGMQNTLRIHVGKILETDNQRSDDDTVVWTGTETLQAIVTPASSTNWLTIVLVLLAVAAVAALALVFLRRRPAGQVAVATAAVPVAERGGFCPHCGQPTPPDAKFCMHCGEPIPPRGS